VPLVETTIGAVYSVQNIKSGSHDFRHPITQEQVKSTCTHKVLVSHKYVQWEVAVLADTCLTMLMSTGCLVMN
jgi:hypothetical protein